MSVRLIRLARALCGNARLSRGQSVVELALILPILTLMTMGTADFGRLFFSDEALVNSAREGAMFGTINPNWITSTDQSDPNNINWHVKNENLSLSLSDSQITTTCYSGTSMTTKSCATASTSDTVKVVVTYPFRPLTPIISSLVGSSLTLSATAQTGVY